MAQLKSLLALLLALLTALSGIGTQTLPATDYALAENWAYCQLDEEGPVDVFFISPTSCVGDEATLIAPVGEDSNAANLGSINMEIGIYQGAGRFFAPYYNQLTLAGYKADAAEQSAALELCYQDVKAAFQYYLENYNQGRPFIIAGFSQGAQHGLQLLKDYSQDAGFQDKLVAAYLIGWAVTQADLDACPELRMAQGETDTGVIVCFECESEELTDSMIVPQGSFSYSINPLNWATDSTPAAKEENPGACFTDYDGGIVSEIPQLCGAYISPERGTLKVLDVTPEEYPAVLDLFPEGCYHIYDYQFFYRSLQENVLNRVNAYLSSH